MESNYNLRKRHKNVKFEETENEKVPVSRARRDVDDTEDFEKYEDFQDSDTAQTIAKQVFIPYLLAALGLVSAGLLLNKIQHWEVFQEIHQLYVLVPSLLGLKGNLEMTLASRMSTAANQGILNDPKERRLIIKGNMALIQCQASVVALFAAVITASLGTFNLYHALILCSAALYTAALASMILSYLMMVIIIKCHECGTNPDNVATPIAASLGDITTLAILSCTSHLLFKAQDSSFRWCIPVSLLFILLSIPFWVYTANGNKYTKHVLRKGWEPVIAAMFISTTGGFILEKAVNIYKGIAIYTPGMNGVGGNLAAIQASRISTYLHTKSKENGFEKPGEYTPDYLTTKTKTKNPHNKSALVLWLLTVPGHILVLRVIALESNTETQTCTFTLVYILAAIVQVGVLLKLANYVTHKFWEWGKDPDNFAIPYLTAFGDLLGQLLLFATFEVSHLMKLAGFSL